MGLEERRLAAEIAGLRREVRAASTTQQLGYSSIENGGRILVKDADGREVMDIGRNPDGSYGATPRIGPTPPQPTVPVLVPTPAGITVRWEGTYLDSLITPDDFSRVEVHLSTDPNIVGDSAEDLVGTIESPRGGDVVVTKLQPSTDYYVVLVARNTAGGRGPKSPTATAASLSHPDGPGTQEALTKAELARIRAEEAKAEVAAATAAANAADQEAQDAMAQATVALASADGKNKITWSTSWPPWKGRWGIEGEYTALEAADADIPNRKPGDVWFVTDPANQFAVLYQWVFTNSIPSASIPGWNAVKLTSTVVSSLTAAKITTGTLSAATTITTGDPNANHTQLGQGGLRVFKLNGDGDPVVTVNVGGAEEDTIQIVDPDTGETRAGLLNDGTVMGYTGNFAELYTGGMKIGNMYDPEDMLFAMPRGRVAGYSMNVDSANFTGLGDVAEIRFSMDPGRLYKITASGNFYKSAAGIYRVQLRYSMDGSDPAAYTGNVNQIGMGFFNVSVNGTHSRATLSGWARANTAQTMRVVLLVENITGGGTVRYYSDPPGWMHVDDMGPVPATPSQTWTDGAMRTTAGGATAPGTSNDAKQKYTKVYAPTWSRTWREGSVRTDTSDMVQGTYGGRDNRAAVGFGGQMASDLSGATIISATLRLRASSWYSSGGGTAIIGSHGYSNVPSSFPGGSSTFTKSWSTKSGVQNIAIPSAWFPFLVSGAHRGYTLGDGASSSTAYYGRFDGATALPSLRPQLTVVYQK